MLGSTLITAILLASPDAAACGGFFCNQAQPVVQNAERVVFDIDEDEGIVETHVQITYEGPSSEFAWIVPAPSEPELFLSTDALFDTLAVQLAPTFLLNTIEEGRCKVPTPVALPGRGVDFAMADAGTAPSEESGVEVVDQSRVGPYATVVLKADSSEALLAWLQDHSYDLPDDLQPLLDPYIAEEAHFVALRLTKDSDTGDLAPLGMRYAGAKAMIPVQLTSVAATPDMRLETYVFSDERAVPESYLHVQINEAAVDWWQGGINYGDVITKAADEAGGHAFATDYAGPVDFLRGQLYVEGQFDLERLRGQPDATSWIYELQGQRFPANNDLADVVLDNVDVPAGVEITDFINCPDCFTGWDQSDFDAETATDDLEVRIVDPLMTAEALLERPFVSRMTSSLDAVEMTVDPVFVLNPDMTDAQVDRNHTANFVYECTGGVRRDRAMRRLELDDGRHILIPSEKWMDDNDTTPFEFIAELGETTAQVIEETGAEGDAHNSMVLDLMRGGCGCAVSGSDAALGGLGMLSVLGLTVLRRRRED
jgi:MYXO-CTERM domain-containing protein